MANEQVVKTFASFEIKDADKGEVEAVIATLGVVDRDEDVIRKDAIADGAKVTMSAWGHDAVFGNRPVGKGVLTVDGNRLKFAGRVFLTTDDGRDTFAVLKEMGADQEWSFGFRVLGSEVPSEAERKQGARRILTKLDAFEVSPVLVGAGVGTRTLGVKSADAQADGAEGEDPTLIADAIAAVKAKRAADALTLAEVKAKEDAEALTKIASAAVATEIARIAAETAETKRLADEAATKAAEDAAARVRAAETQERDRIASLAGKEFERLQHNMRKHKVA